MFRATKSLVIVSLLSFIFAVQSVSAQDLQNEEVIKKLFKESQTLYDQGKYRESSSKLQEIIGLNPKNQLINVLFRESNRKYWAKILQNEVTKRYAKQLDLRYWLWEKRRRRSPEYIQNVIRRMKSNDPDTRNRAIVQLKNIGHFAVPALVSFLKDPLTEDGMRSTVTMALSQMVLSKGEGVLPVMELLDSSDALLLENAAIILGSAKDRRALAPLKKVLEDSRHNKTVKSYVKYAIEEIAEEEVKPASELYYDKALRYLVNSDSVVDEAIIAEGVMYRYKPGDKLVKLNIMLQKSPKFDVPEVSIFAWHLYISEEAIYDALALNLSYEEAAPLLICIYHAQYNQVENSLKDIDRLIDRQILTEKNKKDLEVRKARLVSVKVIAQSAGKEYIYKAIELALKNNLSDVAVSIIEQLKYVTDGSEFSKLLSTKKVKKSKEEIAEIEAVKATKKKKKEEAAAKEKAKEKKQAKKDKKGDKAKADPKEKKMDADKKEGEEAAKKVEDKDKKEEEKKPEEKKEEKKIDDKKEVAKDSKDDKSKDKKVVDKDDKEVVEEEIDPSHYRIINIMSGIATPLVKALDYRDVRVQYEAAMTIAYLNPKTTFPGAEKVIEKLAAALGEKDQISVMIIDSNNQRNLKLTLLLRKCGFLTVSSENGTDGIYFSRSFPSKDVVLIAGDLKGKNAERVYAELQTDFRTKRTPVAIISDKITRVRMREKYAHITDQVIAVEDGQDAILAQIRSIMQKAEAPLSMKKEKELVAIKAAVALATVKRENTIFKLDSCFNAVNKVLSPPERIDAIRLPVINAMAEFKAKPVLSSIVKTYLKAGNAHPIRQASLFAIGEIDPNDPEAFAALRKSIAKDNDQKLRDEGSAAIGKSNQKIEMVIEILKVQRIISELK